ncbi:hypothetical protein BDV19DRAFT_352306 [Aspergillus venezuelensis]
MSLYKCTSCNELIQTTKARLTCASCAPRLTLCANCYVVQDFPPPHQTDGDGSHEIELYRHSGFLPAPPPPPPRQQPVRSLSTSFAPSYGPPRRRPTVAGYSDVPPRKPPRPVRPETRNEIEEVEAPARAPLPFRVPGPSQESSEQQSQRTEQTYQQQPHSDVSGWPVLLDESMRSSSSFTRMVEELFYHLDPQRTGFLGPEVYSDYLDVCGAPYDHNIWKASHAKSANMHGYDMADRELTDHFTSYSVDFALRPRTPPSTPVKSPLDPLSYLPASQRNTLSRFMPSSSVPTLSGGQKPMLSLRGFSDLTLISILLNPSAAWSQLNRIIQAFQIPAYREWGDLPRDALPLAPHQPEVERVRVLLEGARANAQREIDAVHARLKLEQQGRQHALDLLDDRVWVYR